ncbi:2-oxoisovalerate dehydrogenase subunit alpha 1, mitochondrial-like [Bidens hawaiensis]|uniref:2-oxoisovalerate dehydrogenase subunit alpha 1, mitochondrial-like n=1 Tax=Bidens hawaiensis TaxID=980011 RepID=UPI00404B0AE6
MTIWLAVTRGANYRTKTLISTAFRSLRTSLTTFASGDAREGTSRKPAYMSSGTYYRSSHFGASEARQQVNHFSSDDEEDKSQVLDFPGGPVPYTDEMRFLPGSSEKRVQCYRVLDDEGYPLSSTQFQHVRKEVAVKMYSGMVTLQAMDTVIYEAQRQGRISFYMTSYGEEAVNLGSVAALSDDDIVLPQYREPGVMLWRGFELQQFVDQFFGNKNDIGKGRQMPTHYGSNKHNVLTISAPLATQLPQAVGAAYSLKMDKKDACVVTYFGDGCSSEGDFHASLNFAAVMEVPIVYICRNNGWAISTPVTEQFRIDGIVVKGQAYGIQSIRVDGNDVLAVYNAVRAAREIAIKEQRPILIEALTYRVGHHSTSDDSTKYRPVDEIEHWKTARNPVSIFRKWIQRSGWWSDKEESEFRANIRKQVIHAVQVAEKTEKAPIGNIFSDVYEKLPKNLMEQEKLLKETVKRYPRDFPNAPL